MRLKRIVVIFIFVHILSVTGYGQINMVRNAGFEQYSLCPTEYDQAQYANYWSCIDTGWSYGDSTYPYGIPDYVNACSSSIFTSVPNNNSFHHYPHTGNAMMQEITFYDNSTPDVMYQRDYLQERLYQILTAGQSYCVTFYLVLEDGSGYAVNHIGAYLDNGSIDTASNCGLPQTKYIPQILDTPIITDTLNWTKIQGSFTSNGTEHFITIGNFFNDANTNSVHAFTISHYAYYLVDDVSVIASNATAYAGPDVSIALGDSAWIGVDSNGDGMPCYWYVLDSTTAIDSGGRIAVHPTDTTTYVVSMDLCGNVTYDTVRVKVVVGLGVNNVQMQNVQMWPNPVSNKLTITADNKITSIVISNLIGQDLSPALSKGEGRVTYEGEKAVVNVADLPPGVYFVKVNDVVVKRFVKL